MAHIVPLILTAMRDHLEEVLVTNGDASDPTTPSVIKIGRFQDNPVKAIVRVSLLPGDPDDPNVEDGIASLESMKNIGMDLQFFREVGGGELWWRRATAEIGCYWMQDRLEEIDAMNNSYVAAGRIQQAMKSLNLSALQDEFGECAIMLFTYSQTFSEGGGKNQYLWRGKIRWETLTSRP